VEVVASLSQGRTAAAQCGLFTHKSVPVIFEPPCTRLDIPVPLKIQFKVQRLECKGSRWNCCNNSGYFLWTILLLKLQI